MLLRHIALAHRRRTSSSSVVPAAAAAATAKLYIVLTVLSLFHIDGGQTYDTRNQPSLALYGRPHAVAQLRSDVAGDLGDTSSTVHKRSMSWLLAAVMSVCEEDPRRCRSLRRRRLQRLRGRGGGGGGGGEEFDVGDADLGELSTRLLDDDDDVLLPLKRPARSLHTVPLFGGPLTDNCRTESC